MELTKHFYSVLLVSASAKFTESMLSLLPDNRCSPVKSVNDAASAGRCLLENRYDIVIINTPLPDDFGIKLALNAAADSTSGIMLLVKSEHYSDISARVSPYGVLTISKPTSPVFVAQSLQLLCATRERLIRMEQKTASIEEKMEEIRLVNRAKWLLIDNMGMTEQDAHRYIEKQAMDSCVTKRSVAERIIKTYK